MDKVQTIQTKDYIIQEIRREILSGKMTPGEEITQEGIASQLGVSRMPVREAFQVLEQEGFLLRLQNRHMKVAEMKKKHIIEIFYMVGIFETELFSYMNTYEKEKLINELEVLCFKSERMEQVEFFNKELIFHQNAGAVLNNPYINPSYMSFLNSFVSYAIFFVSREKEEVLEQLKEIIRTINLKDRELLKEKLLIYYKSMADHLLKSLEKVHEHK
ncbi:GntR family transcriptional regulator [Lacrimispora sp. 38-1]|uniref:GntR family transcriptional regulator n=1 Tax=Lacrimispora sp. 38-1 TaxID=3125778 RepID=UPI003CEDFC18